MARARRSSTTSTATADGNGTTLICPECGREFTRPASLGAHRKAAHGVAGSSKPKRASSGRRRRSPRTTPTANATGTTGRNRAANRGNGINRDALLGALFPQGVPPRESVIREVAAWLDHAERLVKQR